MRIAITGGTGFVGGHLATRLDPTHTVVISCETGIDVENVDALARAFAGCDAVVHGRIVEPTVAVMGAEELPLADAVRRISDVVGRRPLFIAIPVRSTRMLSQLTEWLMTVPLIAKLQATMLAEGVSEPAPWAPEAPVGIRPPRRFTDESIRAAAPHAGPFGCSDLRVARMLTRRALPARGSTEAVK